MGNVTKIEQPLVENNENIELSKRSIEDLIQKLEAARKKCEELLERGEELDPDKFARIREKIAKYDEMITKARELPSLLDMRKAENLERIGRFAGEETEDFVEWTDRES